jgi:hypothetical protein
MKKAIGTMMLFFLMMGAAMAQEMTPASYAAMEVAKSALCGRR